LSVPELLIASHIAPWKKDEKNRLNPHNGLCLNAIHDKAFDKGFITVTPDYKIKTSIYFKEYHTDAAVVDFFIKRDGQSIIKPNKFMPREELLDLHYNTIFIK
jgi:putative restriction endonuclease